MPPTPTPLTQQLTLHSFTQPIIDLVGGSVPSLPKALILLALGIITIRVLSRILMQVLGLTKLPKGLIKVSVRLLDIVLWLLLVIATLQLLGLSNVAFALSGAFAVLALAFSNGLSSTVSDTISGLNLARDRHFRLGDRVIAGDRKTEGVIIDMDMRKSRLKSADGQIHVIPNSSIDKNEWILVERAGAASPSAASRGVGVKARVAADKLATIRRKGK